MAGDCADPPAGSDSEYEPRVPVAANGSLPATSVALPLRFQAGEPSKSPPGMSTYDESSFQLANG